MNVVEEASQNYRRSVELKNEAGMWKWPWGMGCDR
jgi:hypothetical protein